MANYTSSYTGTEIDTSVGYAITNTKSLTGIFSILNYANGEDIFDGVTIATTALNNAITDATVEGGIVLIPTTENGSTYLIDNDVTIPSNVTLWNISGAILKGSIGTETLTVNGGMNIELFQKFDNIIIDGDPKIDRVYPEWWGAKGDKTTDDIVPMQKTFDFSSLAGLQVDLVKIYKLSSPIQVYNCWDAIKRTYKIKGYNAQIHIFTPMVDTSGISCDSHLFESAVSGATVEGHFYIDDLYVDCNSSGSIFKDIILRGCKFKNSRCDNIQTFLTGSMTDITRVLECSFLSISDAFITGSAYSSATPSDSYITNNYISAVQTGVADFFRCADIDEDLVVQDNFIDFFKYLSNVYNGSTIVNFGIWDNNIINRTYRAHNGNIGRGNFRNNTFEYNDGSYLSALYPTETIWGAFVLKEDSAYTNINRLYLTNNKFLDAGYLLYVLDGDTSRKVVALDLVSRGNTNTEVYYFVAKNTDTFSNVFIEELDYAIQATYEDIGFTIPGHSLESSNSFEGCHRWMDDSLYIAHIEDGTGVWVKIADNLSGAVIYDPPSLLDGAGVTTTVTVTGAVLGDFAVASFSLDNEDVDISANVTAADTVSVRFQNESTVTVDLASGTLRAKVIKA